MAYGYIGVTLSKVLKSHVDMVDVNNRAIHLAEMNIKNNKVDSYAFYSDAYESITISMTLQILPLGQGKKWFTRSFLEQKTISKVMVSSGLLFEKNQGAEKCVKRFRISFHEMKIMDRSKGFYSIKAKKR